MTCVFVGHDQVRRSHGATGHRVLRDGNDVLVLIDLPDEQSAHGFTDDPSLRDAMAKGGVVGAPDISFRSESLLERY